MFINLRDILSKALKHNRASNFSRPHSKLFLSFMSSVTSALQAQARAHAYETLIYIHTLSASLHKRIRVPSGLSLEVRPLRFYHFMFDPIVCFIYKPTVSSSWWRLLWITMTGSHNQEFNISFKQDKPRLIKLRYREMHIWQQNSERNASCKG